MTDFCLQFTIREKLRETFPAAFSAEQVILPISSPRTFSMVNDCCDSEPTRLTLETSRLVFHATYDQNEACD